MQGLATAQITVLRYILKTLTHRSPLLWLSGSLVTLLVYIPLMFARPESFPVNGIYVLIALQLVWTIVLLFCNYQLFSGRWTLERWSGRGLIALGVTSHVVWSWWSGASLEFAFVSFAVMQSGALMVIGVGRRSAFLINSLTYSVVFPFAYYVYERAFPLDAITTITAYVAVHWAGSLWLMQSSTFALKQSRTIRNLLRTSRKDKRTIAEERKKSDRLLLNILPDTVADELKRKGAAAPVFHDSATVMFTDFKGFTSIAESLSPTELLWELDQCFSYFDELCERYGLEKLKTIGDSFMCAGGLPEPSASHAHDCVLAALEIQRFMGDLRIQKERDGKPFWEIRVGIHSGPLVAGVIGRRKFAYDVWGDTVNTASRMESSGMPGEVNISAATYDLIKDRFHCEHRGKISAKNKGEIDMYFVRNLLN